MRNTSNGRLSFWGVVAEEVVKYRMDTAALPKICFTYEDEESQNATKNATPSTNKEKKTDA